MENIQLAVSSAAESKPSEFKQHIYSALQAKVYDALQTRKIEVAGSMFRDSDDSADTKIETEFQSSSEGNVDEDL
jgi:hypothetical protein